MNSVTREPHIRFVDVEKVYPARKAAKQPEVRAVDGISLDVPRGSVLGIVGYSGAGKSSLVRLINALERPTAGQVIVDGTDLTTLTENQLGPVRSRIGMVFQHFNLFSSRTVADNVAYPLRVAGVPKAKIKERVAELLQFVGLSDRARMRPGQLSGGQKQRVGIARALANQPDILLADEATSALDPDTTTEVLALLREINRRFGTTIVVITHEMAVVKDLCTDVAILQAGRVVESGPTYRVFADPQAEVTKRFVSTAIPSVPTGESLQRLRANHRGRLLAVRITDRLSSDATGRLFQKYDVEYGLVFGGLTEVSDSTVGTLVFELTGGPADIEAAAVDIGAHAQVEFLDGTDAAGGSGAAGEAGPARATGAPATAEPKPETNGETR
ncbi:methionine ABC transporter ATP-binding protein [Brevibacterium sp. 50QC2O2]|uniref:methionine ABC transporter ATP-binding protein n=1 Tax=Brevibacterium sp. 50QC2O2 TaxID=2968459 RepID=UPI00211C5E2D|nr:methionine ABC transporter ATP-binding protein [Brevibacterium sp. 50QC2O2]MCQ9389789.1 methionine ABC transporter ATP-binding protein [Brevibacterium sp. 50QC2O2]